MKPEWMGDSNRAIAFPRVSSKKQEGNSSHETQIKEIKEYCRRYGLDLVSVVPIVETASDSEKRKKYTAAEKWADKNHIRHRLYYMADRETRNLTDIEGNEKKARRDGAVLHYVQENKVIHAGSSDSDFFMRDIQAVNNKHFIRLLRTKVNAAFKLKAESGWFPGNHPPLGYVHKHPIDENGRLQKRGTTIVSDKNVVKVKWVQREFELRAQGLSLEQIKHRIISEGVVPFEKVRSYHVSAIERRLKSKFYRGYFDWQGNEYVGKHELIIPAHILKAVDESFGQKKVYAKKGGIFSRGWLRCADSDCGCSVVYDPKVKKLKDTGELRAFHYYHCSNGKSVHATMKGMSVTEEKVWEELGGALDQITITQNFAKDIMAALTESHDRACIAIKRDIAAFTEALNGIDSRRNGLFDLFVAKTIDEETYREQAERLKEQRIHFTDQMAKAQLAISGSYLKTAKQILELATEAKSLWITRSVEERREFLNRILSNQVLDKTTVRYELKKPFSTLAEMKKKAEWRPQRDSNSCP